MHVTAVLDAIKKRGHFKDYKKAQKVYMEHKQAVKSAKASLALLNRTSKGSGKLRKPKKAKEAKAKAKEAEAKSNEAEGVTKVPKDPMKAAFQVDLEKDKKAAKDAQGAITVAASKMFMFYLNLLLPESKYSWNKIIVKQMESNPFANLQGVTHEGPRGMSCEPFNNCMMFHLLTIFPINAAEQEKYYITNVLKKPQDVNVCQFICQAEQLNAYITQMPCFFLSPKRMLRTEHSSPPSSPISTCPKLDDLLPITWNRESHPKSITWADQVRMPLAT
jgi:hypothetical protein